MSSFKHDNSTEGRPPGRGKRYALWHYEEHGDGRTYFRIAPLGWALLLVPAVLAIVALVILFLHNANTPIPETDVTIKPLPTPANPPIQSTIKQPSPPPAPRPVRVGNQAQPPVLSQPTPSAGNDTTVPPPRPSPTGMP